MSIAYRIERELMALGQTTPLYRVIVALPGKRWGTVQAGLDRQSADELLGRLLTNEQNRETAKRVRR